jgi:hypothetical protein
MKNQSFISSLVDRALIALISRPAVQIALLERFAAKNTSDLRYEQLRSGVGACEDRINVVENDIGSLQSEVEKLESSFEGIEGSDFVTDKNLDEALSDFDFSDAIKDCLRNVPFSEFIEVDELADEIVGEISERRQLLDQLDEALVERRATLAAAGGAK